MTHQLLRAPRRARFAVARIAVTGGLLFGLTAVTAAAQPAGGGQGEAELRAACGSDIQTLCPGVQPGGGRLKACLKQNSAKVSLGCKKALVEAKRSRAEEKGAAPATP